ncbi:MAG: hypothetical protein HGA79_07790, partial [Anaerolineales bacterium]|nr:hypothetical protein [Anaerolineales bacterium]
MSINFKRHYQIVIVLVVVVAVLTFALGNSRVIAYTTRAESTATTKSMYDFTNNTDLFDDTVVHSIQVIMSDADYDSMITTYQKTGEKEYFKADVVIDGMRINNVGIRLKGNASLRTALGAGRGFGNFNRPENGQMPEGFDPNNRPQPPQGFNPGEMPQMGENFQMPEAGQGPVGGGMGMGQIFVHGKVVRKVPEDDLVGRLTRLGLPEPLIQQFGPDEPTANALPVRSALDGV